jgi:hypothetical protein
MGRLNPRDFCCDTKTSAHAFRFSFSRLMAYKSFDEEKKQEKHFADI